MRLRILATTALALAACACAGGPPAASGDKLVNTNPALARPNTAAINAIEPGAVECAGLKQAVATDHLVVTSTEFAEATDARPANCMLRGELGRRTGADGKPYFTGFELRLPAKWSGRFMFQGGGGTDGAVTTAIGAAGTGDGPNALARGYAVISTDSGHQGRGPEFGLDPQARIEFAYAALGEVTRTGRAIAETYYGRRVEHSYIAGCSNGGRQAMMATQRFPDLFDGAIAGNPGTRLTRAAAAEAFNTREFNTVAQKDSEGRPITSTAFTPAELTTVSDAVLAACDAKDGLADGYINDVKGCTFDPAVLACKPGQTSACLAPNKTQALARIFAGPKLPSGEAIYAPQTWDAGISAPGWRAWMLGSSPTAQGNSMNASLGFGAIRYYFLSPPNPDYDPATFDAARDWPKMQATMEINDADEPNIDAFEAKGGKLIIYHGASDPVFSAADSMAWIDGLPAGADAYARLFLVPGMNHCGGGPATDRFDALAALEAWVERGEAPARITARNADVERPLCPYPQAARYTGGDTKSAASFTCTK